MMKFSLKIFKLKKIDEQNFYILLNIIKINENSNERNLKNWTRLKMSDNLNGIWKFE